MPETGNKRTGADWTAIMPKQIVPAANLLTPQLGAAAAVSALGFGFASQMWGLWAGAIAGALDANATFKPMAKPASIPATDVDALKTIIRKRSSDHSPKRVEAPVLESQQPAAVENPVQPVVIETAIVSDDLKHISGIGPKLEQVLKGMGIHTCAQIAAWTPEEVAQVDDRLQFEGRILRDDWVGQAAALAEKSKD
jgi:NADH-quinone oxidoreductase subunit E